MSLENQELISLMDENSSLKKRILELEQQIKGKNSGEDSIENYIKLYDYLLGDSPDLCWIKDSKNKYLYANKSMRAKLLCADENEDIVGKADLFFALRERSKRPDNSEWHTFGEICRDTDLTVVKTLKKASFHEYGNVKGKFLSLNVNKIPLLNYDGILIGVVGIGRDITREEEMEKILSLQVNSDKHLSYIIHLDLDGAIVSFPAPLRESLGFSSEEIENKLFYDLCNGEHKTKLFTGITKTANGITDSIRLDFSITDKFGVNRIMRGDISLVKDSRSVPVTIYLGLEEITSTNELSNELSSLEHLFSQVWVNSYDAMRLTDDKGIIVSVNNSFCKLVGLSKNDLVGVHFSVAYNVELREQIAESFSKRVSQNALEQHTERELVLWNGESVWYEANHNLVVDDSGQKRILSIFRNITDRKWIENSLVKHIDRLHTINSLIMTSDLNPETIINNLVGLLGKSLGAACALYNRLDSELLCTFGSWNVPDDYLYQDNPAGHICYDLISNGVEDVVVLSNLQDSKYLDTDINVRRYNLQTYVGKVVKDGDKPIGSLCAVFTDDYVLSESDKELITFLSNIIVAENSRLSVLNALKDKSEHLRTLINSMPSMVCFKDGNGRWLEANKYDLELFGLTNVEYVGKKDSELAQYTNFYREAFLACEDSDEIAWHNKSLTKGIEYIPTITGEPLVFDITKIPVFHSDGRRKGLVVLGTDITEQRKVESALKASEQRYRAVVEEQTELIARSNFDGVITFVNSSYCHFFNRRSEDVVGSNIYNAMSPKTKELVSLKRTLISKEKPIITYEYERTNNMGERVFLEWTEQGIFDNKDTLLEILSVGHDITERKKAEDKLRFLGSIAENVSDCIVATDQSFKVIYLNKAAENLYRYNKVEMLGQNYEVLIAEKMFEFILMEIYDNVSAGQQWMGELLHKTKFNEEFLCKINFAPLVSELGEIIFIGIHHDITAERAQETDLRLAKEKAEESDKIKTSLLANMSHEFRTPMNGILGFSEILSQELEGADEAKMARSIFVSGRRLMTTLNNIMDLAQFQANSGFINPMSFIVSDKVRTVCKPFKSALSDKGIEFEFSSLDSEIMINADERLFSRILDNLLDNAIKFTNSGKVTVSVKSVQNDKSAFAQIDVADTGIGIPESSHKFIFEEFRQLSEGLGRKYEGSGLGLTVAKKMAEVIEAEITVSSQPGVGSTFSLIIPGFYENGESKASIFSNIISLAESQTPLELNHTPSILTVEDNVVNVEVVKKYLKKYNVDFAENSEEAIELAKKNSYDLVLMDINLGRGKNGIETAKEIREIDGYTFVPIIAVTGYAMQGDSDSFLEAGFDGYLAKPFTKAGLIDLVKEMLFL